MTSYYASSVIDFLSKPDAEILGTLTKATSEESFNSIETAQTWSWMEEISILKNALGILADNEYNSAILLEYLIPRRGKRIDTVILAHGIIFVLEFKIGAFSGIRSFDKSKGIEQCEDYALDLRDFHQGSKDRVIIPIVFDNSTTKSLTKTIVETSDKVKTVKLVSKSKDLMQVISDSISTYGINEQLNFLSWDQSVYHPTPTIIEAAQRLYSNHSIKEITTSGADKYNLTDTTTAVLHAIDFAKKNRKKAIVFVTGVPGSGKTLVGLNIAHDVKIRSAGYHAAFISGNYPLVTVLQQALAIDEAKRKKRTLKMTVREAKTKIQLIVNFKEQYSKNEKEKPFEQIIIFDEAQRAWTADYMAKQSRRKSKPYTTSEPELIMDIMDRHLDWAVIICLVGIGQEIHNGEAGLKEWGNTIKKKHSDWVIFGDQEAIGSQGLDLIENSFFKTPNSLVVNMDCRLYLKTSVRSFKAVTLSNWVNAVIGNDPSAATKLIPENSKYPIVVTRDFQKAKEWIKTQCRGMRSVGLVCSSGAKRLRPEGIETEIEIDVAKWFLSNKSDIRSSSFMELPATEFKIQGLELDWVCLAWDLNLARNGCSWLFRRFKGTSWNEMKKDIQKEYLLNAYRVLMTRGREGLIIFVPSGKKDDVTRSPELYDGICSYLKQCGVTELL